MRALSYWDEYIQLLNTQDYFLKSYLFLDFYTEMTMAANCAIKAYDANPEGLQLAKSYIELAREFHSVMISGVPIFTPANNDAARRFINLVDEFYDRSVKLAVTAAAPLYELYSGGRLEFEFQRTESRLLEMQSHEYLARPHRP